MPHKHSNVPKVDMHIFEGAVTQLNEIMQGLTNEVSVLEGKIFNGIAGIRERLQILEKIYVIIGFLKIENVCDNMFSD